MNAQRILKRTRLMLLFFMAALFLSGVTALPIEQELSWILQTVAADSVAGVWGMKVLKSYQTTKQQYPFLLYGYDWLAFAHFVLALLFIGPYNNPVKNHWVIQFGLIACVLVVPFALVAGGLHGIPFWWRLIDCSFGVVGIAVLWPCHQNIKTLTAQYHNFFKPPYANKSTHEQELV